DGSGRRPWKPFVPIRRDGGDDDARKPQDCHNDVTFMLSRHSKGASRRGRAAIYPWIKAVRTRDEKGNSAMENITKLTPWIHPKLERHPLDVALCGRWEGDDFT